MTLTTAKRLFLYAIILSFFSTPLNSVVLRLSTTQFALLCLHTVFIHAPKCLAQDVYDHFNPGPLSNKYDVERLSNLIKCVDSAISSKEIKELSGCTSTEDVLAKLNGSHIYRQIKRNHKTVFALIYGKQGLITTFKKHKDIKQLQQQIIKELDAIQEQIIQYWDNLLATSRENNNKS